MYKIKKWEVEGSLKHSNIKPYTGRLFYLVAENIICELENFEQAYEFIKDYQKKLNIEGYTTQITYTEKYYTDATPDISRRRHEYYIVEYNTDKIIKKRSYKIMIAYKD